MERVQMERNIYLALGDAVTAGQGASQPALGFMRRVGDFASEKSLTKRTIAIAQPGWTAKTLFHMVQTLRPTLWSEVRLVTIFLGVADFARLLKPRRLSLDGNPFPPRTVLRKADEFGYYTDQLFRFIKDKQIPHVFVTTLYNPFPLFMPACRFVEGMNSVIADCASHYGFSVVHVDKSFSNNEAYLVDGYRTGSVHDLMTPLRKPMYPNNAGHKLIAELITKRLNQKLSKRKTSNAKKPLRNHVRGRKK